MGMTNFLNLRILITLTYVKDLFYHDIVDLTNPCEMWKTFGNLYKTKIIGKWLMLKQNLYNLQLANDKKMGDLIKEVKQNVNRLVGMGYKIPNGQLMSYYLFSHWNIKLWCNWFQNHIEWFFTKFCQSWGKIIKKISPFNWKL